MASKTHGGSLVQSGLDSVGVEIIDEDDNTRKATNLIELTDSDDEGKRDSDEGIIQKSVIKMGVSSSDERDEIKDNE